jgi:hypothetical protein
MLGKLAFAIAAAGGLSLAALSPAPVEAGAIHLSLGPAAAIGDSDVVQVRVPRCVRSLSNLWSCNTPVSSAPAKAIEHPCDHSWQTARDGSRCGNRAADKRKG